ncbi:response regulator [[Clostridium] polysaccharolyticum]|jgi:two-component system chemotaxis response regulator CheY|uniref:Stage 0 sporulation protein A homolog n=1 Tax=[Clostridium] polysaccharolyticum TaxID=29364 RepID=A0A1I0FNG9_9FIRM|nr:response regulator [[Clostridium] polysaccharolyticum]SET59119.1 two-component system, chemotaxis family, response regulator CheY [[Clostridium] polysaccharolyticum]
MAKILIIDDSKTSRKILKNLLQAEGHEIVAEAQNGEEGIKKFEECRPDIVTMDITMPVMDGIEALRKIRNIDVHAKVVMVTAAGQANKMYEAVKYGASEFLAKPFEPEQISEIISRILED